MKFDRVEPQLYVPHINEAFTYLVTMFGNHFTFLNRKRFTYPDNQPFL